MYKKVIKGIRKPTIILSHMMNNGLFKNLPDNIYLEIKYKLQMGKKLDLKQPLTLSEKLQWLKLYNRNPEYTKMVDKYEVRKYIEATIGSEVLIPLIGVWDRFEDIDFSKLPNQFVLKCTHDSGGLIICKDKEKLNIKKAKQKINRCLNRNFYYKGREWPYKDVKPRIICEKYMVDESGVELKDYKFHCFNGKVKLILLCKGRSSTSGAKYDFYNEEWNLLDLQRPNHPSSGIYAPKPIQFDKMIEYAEILSRDQPFLRIDFYEVEGKLYFGEITFYPTSGFAGFEPNYYDELLGSWIELSQINIKGNLIGS